jgi:hypothetical protein
MKKTLIMAILAATLTAETFKCSTFTVRDDSSHDPLVTNKETTIITSKENIKVVLKSETIVFFKYKTSLDGSVVYITKGNNSGTMIHSDDQDFFAAIQDNRIFTFEDCVKK